MGAWSFLHNRMPDMGWQVISRRWASSPATGFKKVHDEQQATVVKQALGLMQ